MDAAAQAVGRCEREAAAAVLVAVLVVELLHARVQKL